MLSCSICDSKKIRFLFIKRGYEYFRCNSCKVIFSPYVLEKKEVENFYDFSYYDAWRNERDNLESVKISKNKSFINWLNKIELYVKKGKLLDIGCAMGFFLEIAKNRGWDVWGVEVSSYASSIAKEKFKDRIFKGFLNEANFKKESFDLITMFDLLEHQSEPVNFLILVHSLLKNGGYIALSTIDTQSLSCKILGKHWTHFKAPEHLFYFSIATLQFLFKKIGFDIVYVSKAEKFINLSFMNSYFGVYYLPVVSEGISFLFKILPKKLTSLPIRLPTGEIFLIAKKVN